jgi:hypothetical protein
MYQERYDERKNKRRKIEKHFYFDLIDENQDESYEETK